MANPLAPQRNPLAGYMLRQLLQPQRSPYINWFENEDAQNLQHDHPQAQGDSGVDSSLQGLIQQFHELSQSLHAAMANERDASVVATYSKCAQNVASCTTALTGLQRDQAPSVKGAVMQRMNG